MSIFNRTMPERCFLSSPMISQGLKTARNQFVGDICAELNINTKHCTSFLVLITDFDLPTEKGMMKADMGKYNDKLKAFLGGNLVDMLEPDERKKAKDMLPEIEPQVNGQIEKMKAEYTRKIELIDTQLESRRDKTLQPNELKLVDNLHKERAGYVTELEKLKDFKLFKHGGKLKSICCTFNYIYWFMFLEYEMQDGFRESVVYPQENPKYQEWCKLSPRPDFIDWVENEMKKETV